MMISTEANDSILISGLCFPNNKFAVERLITGTLNHTIAFEKESK